MCDYSLYTVKNRLACETDDLQLHRFETGSKGFCAVAELRAEAGRGPLARGWSSFVSWLLPRRKCGLTAVCLPPGAKLLITHIPEHSRGLPSGLALEAVYFTQLSETSFAYRDAIRLPDGAEILLQKLPEGLRATVLSVGVEEEAHDSQTLNRPHSAAVAQHT